MAYFRQIFRKYDSELHEYNLISAILLFWKCPLHVTHISFSEFIKMVSIDTHEWFKSISHKIREVCRWNFQEIAIMVVKCKNIYFAEAFRILFIINAYSNRIFMVVKWFSKNFSWLHWKMTILEPVLCNFASLPVSPLLL